MKIAKTRSVIELSEKSAVILLWIAYFIPIPFLWIMLLGIFDRKYDLHSLNGDNVMMGLVLLGVPYNIIGIMLLVRYLV